MVLWTILARLGAVDRCGTAGRGTIAELTYWDFSPALKHAAAQYRIVMRRPCLVDFTTIVALPRDNPGLQRSQHKPVQVQSKAAPNSTLGAGFAARVVSRYLDRIQVSTATIAQRLECE